MFTAVLLGENQLLNELLSSYLLHHGFTMVKSFQDASIALEYISLNPPPDLVLLDLIHPSLAFPANTNTQICCSPRISLDNQITLSTIYAIKNLSPQTKIMLLSGKRHPFFLYLSLQGGVNGVASKGGGLSEFLDILQRVLRGEHNVVSVRIQEELVEFQRKFTNFHLSPTEIKILEMLREGMNSPQIARELGYSTKTIRNAIHKLYKKFGTSNRMEVIEIAVQIGIIS